MQELQLNKKAQIKYFEGVKCLEQASKNDKNKDLILKASNLFFESIALDSKFIDSYLSLAYIFYIYEDFEKSLQLLNVALSYSPEHYHAQKMVTEITTKLKNQGFQKSLNDSDKNSKKEKSGILTSMSDLFYKNKVTSASSMLENIKEMKL